MSFRDDQGEGEEDAEWNFAMDTIRAPKEPGRKNVLPESSQQQESTVEQNHIFAEEPGRTSWVPSEDLERRDQVTENVQEKETRLSNGVDHLESHSLSQNSALQNSLLPERGSESQQYNGLVPPASSTESRSTNADKMENEEEEMVRESVTSDSLPDTRELDEVLARSSVVSVGSVGSRESSGSGGSGGRDKPPSSALNQVTDIDDVMEKEEGGEAEEELKEKDPRYSDLEVGTEVGGAYSCFCLNPVDVITCNRLLFNRHILLLGAQYLLVGTWCHIHVLKVHVH